MILFGLEVLGEFLVCGQVLTLPAFPTLDLSVMRETEAEPNKRCTQSALCHRKIQLQSFEESRTLVEKSLFCYTNKLRIDFVSYAVPS